MNKKNQIKPGIFKRDLLKLSIIKIKVILTVIKIKKTKGIKRYKKHTESIECFANYDYSEISPLGRISVQQVWNSVKTLQKTLLSRYKAYSY